jgi:hypothetical protein
MIEQGLVNEIALKAQQNSSSAGLTADVVRLVREGVIDLQEALRVVG